MTVINELMEYTPLYSDICKIIYFDYMIEPVCHWKNVFDKCLHYIKNYTIVVNRCQKDKILTSKSKPITTKNELIECLSYDSKKRLYIEYNRVKIKYKTSDVNSESYFKNLLLN